MWRKLTLFTLPALALAVIVTTTLAWWNPWHLRYAEPLSVTYPLPALTVTALLIVLFFRLKVSDDTAAQRWWVFIGPGILAVATVTSYFVTGYKTVHTLPTPIPLMSGDGRYELVAEIKRRRWPGPRRDSLSEPYDLTPQYTVVLLRSRNGLQSRQVEVLRGGDVEGYRFSGPHTVMVFVRPPGFDEAMGYSIDFRPGSLVPHSYIDFS